MNQGTWKVLWLKENGKSLLPSGDWPGWPPDNVPPVLPPPGDARRGVTWRRAHHRHILSLKRSRGVQEIDLKFWVQCSPPGPPRPGWSSDSQCRGGHWRPSTHFAASSSLCWSDTCSSLCRTPQLTEGEVSRSEYQDMTITASPSDSHQPCCPRDWRRPWRCVWWLFCVAPGWSDPPPSASRPVQVAQSIENLKFYSKEDIRPCIAWGCWHDTPAPPPCRHWLSRCWWDPQTSGHSGTLRPHYCTGLDLREVGQQGWSVASITWSWLVTELSSSCVVRGRVCYTCTMVIRRPIWSKEIKKLEKLKH